MTSNKLFVLMFAEAIFHRPARAMPGWANPASAGNDTGRAESGKVLRTIPVGPYACSSSR